jgi:HPt (histidine-containing phosphotransfer) domain-containing protein
MTSETKGTQLERVGGDLELLREIVSLFAEDAPQLESIRNAIVAGDAKAAHALKLAVANFEPIAVADEAFRLERLGRAGILGGAAELCDALTKSIDDLISELWKLCEEPRA